MSQPQIKMGSRITNYHQVRFAPNVILSGLAARHGLRMFETPVPQHDRTTGEVSIKKWKLLKSLIERTTGCSFVLR